MLKNRKIKALIALLVTLGAIIGIQMATASAEATSSTWYKTGCTSYWSPGPGREARFCAQAGWRTQDDGGGIRVEDFKLGGTCGQFEDGQPFHNVHLIVSQYPNGGGAGTRRDYVDLPCDKFIDVEIKVDEWSDKLYFSVTTDIAVDLAPDRRDASMAFYICRYDSC